MIFLRQILNLETLKKRCVCFDLYFLHEPFWQELLIVSIFYVVFPPSFIFVLRLKMYFIKVFKSRVMIVTLTSRKSYDEICKQDRNRYYAYLIKFLFI